MRPSAALLRGGRRLLVLSSSRGNWRWSSVGEEASRGPLMRRHSKSVSAAAAAASAATTTPPPPPPPPRLPAGLYVVATPIGNLEDLSPRAARVLATADAVLCEDTRRSGPLVAAAVAAASVPRPSSSAPSRLVSLHAHNELARTASVLERLSRGEAIALVSDAGTPAVSDPGGGVAAAAAAAGFDVVPVPGPCAAAAAVSACGLDAGDWLFVGFLPAKAGARLKRLRELAAATGGGGGASWSDGGGASPPSSPPSSSVSAAVVVFVPARSLAATLADAALAFGPGRRVAVARELTKLHEEWWRGGLAEGAAEFAARATKGAGVKGGEGGDEAEEGEEEAAAAAGGEEDGTGGNRRLLKGEVTIVIERAKTLSSSALSAAEGGEEDDDSNTAPLLLTLDADAALSALLLEGVPPSAAARALAGAAGVPRGPLYTRAQRLSSASSSSSEGTASKKGGRR